MVSGPRNTPALLLLLLECCQMGHRMQQLRALECGSASGHQHTKFKVKRGHQVCSTKERCSISKIGQSVTTTDIDIECVPEREVDRLAQPFLSMGFQNPICLASEIRIIRFGNENEGGE
uniref:Putative secreted protein n=1 Tax=Anopheles darlingi TaxID=43151 RepID=A0A2M4DJA3_ANODA